MTRLMLWRGSSWRACCCSCRRGCSRDRPGRDGGDEGQGRREGSRLHPESLDGKPFTLSSMLGKKIVMLDFWPPGATSASARCPSWRRSTRSIRRRRRVPRICLDENLVQIRKVLEQKGSPTDAPRRGAPGGHRGVPALRPIPSRYHRQEGIVRYSTWETSRSTAGDQLRLRRAAGE